MTEPDTGDAPTDDGVTDNDAAADATDGDPDAAESIGNRVPWRRIGNAIGVVVLIAIVLPFVIYAVPQVVGADGSYVVLSGSMEPEISSGDVIVVESVEPSAIEEGDVITYARGEEGQTTTHRVTEVNEREGGYEFRTKGDANEQPDREPVAGSRVEGRVMSVGGHLFVIPFLGYVVQFAGTRLGFGTLVVAPIALFVLSEVWELVASSDESESVDEGRSGEAAETAFSEGTSESSDGWVTLRADELALGLVAMGAFAAYSVWVAYAARTVWAIGVAASVITAFLLLLGLYASGRRGETNDAEKSAGTTDAPAEDALAESTTGTSTEPADGVVREGTSDEVPSLEQLWGAETEPNGSATADRTDGEEVDPRKDGEPAGDRPGRERPADASRGESAGGSVDD